MEPAEWRRVEEILERVMALEAARRPAFLDEACAGDEGLRREVESLLAYEVQVEQFLPAPVLAMFGGGVAATPARFPEGQGIGPYRIVKLIGRGGMGEVYQARDTRLDRTVALKVLPRYATTDAEQRKRLLKEARAASALNHPNIVTLHDILSQDGRDALVMEHIAGQTLQQKIGRKGLPVKEALHYAIQVADALAAAHAAGIVHRDIKPGNIMVTANGTVKVLDFGLAKLHTVLGPDDDPASVTAEGTIAGTIAYMSPEQAQGRRVDARTDIFSFGCVLYEMATGRHAFPGENALSTMAAVLREEPKPMRGPPVELERIVARCLRKDPERRIPHMLDVKLALEDLKDDWEAGRLDLPAPTRTGFPWKPALIVAGMALAAITAGGVWLWRTTAGRDAVRPPDLTRLTWDAALALDPALSPDGKLLVYASNRSSIKDPASNLDLWLQQIGGGEPFRLTQDPANESQPAFSPDGTRIVYRSDREGGGIYVISTLGGAALRIATQGTNPSFSPAGDLIVYYTGLANSAVLANASNKLFVVSPGGGQPREIGTGFSGVCCAIWTPDGKHLLFLGNQDDRKPLDTSLDWWVVAVDGGPTIKTGVLERTRARGLRGTLDAAPVALTPGAWTPQRDGVVFSARSGDSTNLWRIPIDPWTYQAAGEPQRLTFGTSYEWAPSVAAQRGDRLRVVFASLDENTDVWAVPISGRRDAAGKRARRLTEEASIEQHVRISEDGRRLAFLSNRTGSFQVWLKDLETGEQRALTTSPVDKYLPVFSRDGTQLTYSAPTAGKWGIRRLRLSDGADDLICDSCALATSWTPDGGGVVYLDVPGRVSLLDLTSRRSTLLLARQNYRLVDSQLSPDGRWILFRALSGARAQIYIAAYRGPAKIEEDGWIALGEEEFALKKAAWSDGNAVIFTSDRDGFLCLWIQPLDPATKRPNGPASAVYHAHSAQHSMAPMTVENTISVGGGMVVFLLAERTGNLWMAEWK